MSQKDQTCGGQFCLKGLEPVKPASGSYRQRALKWRQVRVANKKRLDRLIRVPGEL